MAENRANIFFMDCSKRLIVVERKLLNSFAMMFGSEVRWLFTLMHLVSTSFFTPGSTDLIVFQKALVSFLFFFYQSFVVQFFRLLNFTCYLISGKTITQPIFI